MERSLFGFKPVPLSTVELVYYPDCTLSHYYVQMERKGYPCIVSAKFNLKDELTEFYPVYIGSLKNSLDLITKNISYLGHYDYKHYAYLSWDLVNEPNEIYLPKGPGYIEKYKDEELDAKYYTVDIDKIDECQDLTDMIRDFVKNSGADIFMYVTKQGILKKFCLLYNFANDLYLDKRLLIKPLQDKWLDFKK